jgi:photosystem II stability/assembly factor-like uncharacterized protein
VAIIVITVALAACGGTGTVGGGPTTTATEPSPTAMTTPLPGGWSTVPGIGEGYVPRIAFAPSLPTTAYACILNLNSKIAVSVTHDGGATWQSLGTPLSGSGLPCSITVNPRDAQDVVVDDGNSHTTGLVRSRDGGKTWNRPSVGSIAFLSWGWVGSTFYVATALTDSGSSGSQLTTLYASADGGPFVRLDKDGKLGGIALQMVRFIGGTNSTIFLQVGQIIQPIGETTYASTDGGKTWTTVTFHDGGRVIHLYDTAPDGQTLVGVNDTTPNQLAISADAGQTWRRLPAAPNNVPGFDWLMISPDGTVVATSSNLGSSSANDASIYEARTGDAQWHVPAVAPNDAYPGAVAWDTSGHPTQVWATHALGGQGAVWDLIMHPL